MYKIIIITIEVCLLSACASSGRSFGTNDCRPDWFEQPSTTPDIIFSYGQGKNQQQARTIAEAMLSRILKSTISTHCQDRISSQPTPITGFPQNTKNVSVCQTDSQSRLNLTTTPTAKLSQCGGQSFVRIDYDHRPIAKRLSLNTLNLSVQEQEIITQTQGLPYSLMTRKSSGDKVHVAFNKERQSWTLSTPTHTTTANIDEFINKTLWQSCEGDRAARFKIKHKGHRVDTATANTAIEIDISVPERAKYLNIVNIVENKGLKQLHDKPIKLSNWPKKFTLPLIATLLPGQIRSHEIYLAIFTAKPQHIVSSEHYAHPGSAMAALITTLNSHTVVAHCARTLDIYQKNIY